jgi:hypothetical protein
MDHKLEVLVSFDNLVEKKVKILPENVRHIRLILSIFNEEILHEDEYDQLIKDLIDEGFLLRSKSEEIVVTPIGSALVKSIGRTKLGETNFDRLLHITSDYIQSKSSPEFIKTIGERLKSFHNAKENKIKSVDPNSIHALGILIKNVHISDELFTSEFTFSTDYLKDNAIFNREISKLKYSLIRTHNVPFLVTSQGNSLKIYGVIEVNAVTFFNSPLNISKKYVSDRKNISSWNTLIVTTFLENALKKIGFVASRGRQNNFINLRNCTIPQGSSGLREYDSIKLEFFDLSDDHIFVFIETYKTTIHPVLDFININLKNGVDSSTILQKIKKLKLKANPYGNVIEVKELLQDIDLKQEKIPGKEQSLYEYWEQVHNITLSQIIQPVIITQTGLSYPAEMVKIDKNSLITAYGLDPKRKPKYENIKERFEKIEFLFNYLATYHNEDFEKFFVSNVIENSSNLRTLIDLKCFKGLLQVSPPVLEFFRESASIDPIDIFNPEYGAHCGKKNLVISHLILPNPVNDTQINAFFESIQRIFTGSNFGTLKKATDLKIKRYDANPDTVSLQNEIRKLEHITNPNAVAFVVIPDQDTSHYFTVKKLFPVRTGVCTQIITQSTFDEIVFSRFLGSKFLALQILIKSLKHGEAVWTLASSAGLLKENTLYVGLGFSQQVQEGKISKCATVMHDSHGAKISWKVFATPHQGRTLDAFWFETMLHRTYDIIEKEKPTRIMFYRTGTLFPIERSAIETAMIKCPWLNSIKLSFVSILDGSNCRFFKTNGKKINLPAGYGIIINEDEAFLSTSNYDNRELRQGTVVPVKIKLEFGNDAITDILKEYHDLTYLNWQAPITTAKHPLVVMIADRFAELTREGVPTENTFYLDL